MSFDIQQALDSLSGETKSLFSELRGALSPLERRIEGVEAQLKRADDGGHTGGSAKTWAGPGSQIDEQMLRLAQQTGMLRYKCGHLWSGHEVGRECKTLIDSTAVGSSTPGILVPARTPGITPLPRRRLTVRDLLRSRPTANNAVEFVKENTFANAASVQVEGEAKGESAMDLTIASERVRTLAHWLPATKQILQDLPGLRDFIDRNLMYGLKLKEESELLYGSGVGEHLNGLATQATPYVGTYASANDTKLDAIRHGFLEVEARDEQVDFLILNPIDLHDIQLLKGEDSGAANTGAYIVSVPTGNAIVKTLWSVPVVATNSMAAGYFLCGDSSKSEIFDSMDATIEISDSHDDYFVKNKIAIRCEERLVLAVYRATALCYGSF